MGMDLGLIYRCTKGLKSAKRSRDIKTEVQKHWEIEKQRDRDRERHRDRGIYRCRDGCKDRETDWLRDR